MFLVLSVYVLRLLRLKRFSFHRYHLHRGFCDFVAHKFRRNELHFFFLRCFDEMWQNISTLHIVANLVCFASDMKFACSLKIIVSLYTVLTIRTKLTHNINTSIHLATRCVELFSREKRKKNTFTYTLATCDIMMRKNSKAT